MRQSLDSSRPMLSTTDPKRASKRMSTYSIAASSSINTERSASSAATDAELRMYNTTYVRMEDKRLQEQRYVISREKDETMSKLALGAKVQKALDRRYTNQDAIWRPKKPAVVSEKS